MDVFGVGKELLAGISSRLEDRLNEGEVILVTLVLLFEGLIKGFSECKLTWHVVTVDRGLMHEEGLVDELLWSNCKANLPSSAVEGFASTENIDCLFPIVFTMICE